METDYKRVLQIPIEINGDKEEPLNLLVPSFHKLRHLQKHNPIRQTTSNYYYHSITQPSSTVDEQLDTAAVESSAPSAQAKNSALK